jgi:ribosome-binding protein aMBF1 (putative translation factor)
MEHQDWKPVVFINPSQTTSSKKPQIRSEVLKEIKLDQANEPNVVKKYTNIHQTNLRKLRSEKNLTQKQLAQQLNINLKDIQDIENMTGVYKQNIISKINNRFKMNLNKSEAT